MVKLGWWITMAFQCSMKRVSGWLFRFQFNRFIWKQGKWYCDTSFERKIYRYRSKFSTKLTTHHHPSTQWTDIVKSTRRRWNFNLTNASSIGQASSTPTNIVGSFVHHSQSGRRHYFVQRFGRNTLPKTWIKSIN